MNFQFPWPIRIEQYVSQLCCGEQIIRIMSTILQVVYQLTIQIQIS